MAAPPRSILDLADRERGRETARSNSSTTGYNWRSTSGRETSEVTSYVVEAAVPPGCTLSNIFPEFGHITPTPSASN